MKCFVSQDSSAKSASSPIAPKFLLSKQREVAAACGRGAEIECAYASAKNALDVDLYLKLLSRMTAHQLFDAITAFAASKEGMPAIKQLFGIEKPHSHKIQKTIRQLVDFRNEEAGMSLMHIASFYSNNDLIKLLLSEELKAVTGKKFDIDGNDSMGRGAPKPIQLAIMFGDIKTVELLNQSGASLTKADSQWPIELELPLKAKGQRDELAKTILSKGSYGIYKRTHSEPTEKFMESVSLIAHNAELCKEYLVPKQQSSYIDFDRAECEYYKALFSTDEKDIDRHAQNFLQMAVGLFQKEVVHSSEISPATSEIPGRQNAEYITLFGYFIYMNVFYKFMENQELRNVIIEAAKLVEFFDIADGMDSYPEASLYNELCFDALNKSIIEAVDWGNRALHALSKHDINIATSLKREVNIAASSELRGQINYNLGLALKFHDSKKAIEHFTEVRRCLPDDQESLEHMWFIHFQYYNYVAAKVIASQMPSPKKDLLILRSLLGGNEICADKAFEESQKIEQVVMDYAYFELLVDIEHNRQNYEAALGYINQGLVVSLNTHDVEISFIARALVLFQEQGKFIEGSQYLDQVCFKNLWIRDYEGYLPLKYYEFLMRENANQYDTATEILEKIIAVADQGSFARYVCDLVHQTRYATEIERKNYVKARECLKYMSFYDMDVSLEMLTSLETASRTGGVAADIPTELDFAIIETNIAKMSAELVALSSAVEGSSGDAASQVDSDPNEAIFVADPVSVEAYFRKKKIELSRRTLNEAKTQDHSSWKLPGGHEYHEGDEGLHPLDLYGKFYGLVDQDVNVDSQLLDQFNIAIQKGFVRSKVKANGVKLLYNGSAELKIKSDVRLLPDIFVNPCGKYLMVFNKDTNHRGVKNSAKLKADVTSVDFAQDIVKLKSIALGDSWDLSISAAADPGECKVELNGLDSE